MTTATFDAVARNWARDLEDRERIRSGVPLPVARKSVARRVGIPAGTLETLRNGRRKGLSAWLFARLQSAVIAEMNREISRCAHELEIARQAGLDPRSDEMAALEAAVSRAKVMLGERA